ncbi:MULTISPECIES: DNA polymerase/3'-5' exonuclease PolX [unclassified Imperialibacter]|uniref:DNA polymerase/3'-5' exonuclease PolX n=1 Tax=unclassified Imperialibacter TaxID=2629706 RepID=UPI00125C55F6|nr:MULTISPECIES: DNA polymerase/3'-5' exonuclease PolX [unclassified Imperialibacter]CAD5265528.1 DNA polymerase X family [Imperialibacter sp. 89]CAD5270358.1 DNA polymerase X family [Imperialibacter sp. 75]VVT10002.1 DNA polymerase X family [Imperialibacter sp. EC-SDR9]
MTESNKKLAAIFKNIAASYRFLGGENPFRAIAYDKASRSIASLPEDISVYISNGTTEDIPGVGESMAEDIQEFAAKGTVPRFERLKSKVPIDLLELMDISGFGPQSLKTIYTKLHLQTKDEIVDALKDGTIARLYGFGAKKVETMMRGLKLHKTIENRMLLWEALEVGNKIVTAFEKLPFVQKAALAGSLRRGRETIGDIDVLVAVLDKDRKKVADHFTKQDVAARILVKGDTKVSILLKDLKRQADLRIVTPDEWGSALQYFTGSKEHNIHLRTKARDMGFKVSEYGVFEIQSGRRVGGATEKEVYNLLGMQLMPAEMREDKGEIGLAAMHRIPKLVELSDIKGDLQMHSTWSDGIKTLEEIASYVIQNFPYDYIAMTDHSKASRIAKGMDEEGFLRQIKAIRELNSKLGKNFIKSGAEVDVLADGSLDLSEEVLSQLDWVTASIHSGLRSNNTDRLIKACESPWVHCIGHPTGRLIGRREPYPVDFKRLLEAAKETGTALEVNAQPNRMDLNDELARQAREAGVMLVISTDSHSPENFSYMKIGVTVARRAWCTADNILNTRSWNEIEKFIRNKQKTMKVHA